MQHTPNPSPPPKGERFLPQLGAALLMDETLLVEAYGWRVIGGSC